MGRHGWGRKGVVNKDITYVPEWLQSSVHMHAVEHNICKLWRRFTIKNFTMYCTAQEVSLLFNSIIMRCYTSWYMSHDLMVQHVSHACHMT